MTDTARAHLVHAFRKVLRPLVKILIRAGVRYDEFLEVIKGVFVESAIRDGIGRGGPLTRTRVALVTGVTRRDVDRYVDNEDLLAPPSPTLVATLSEVLHLWNTDPSFLGPYGVPLEIDLDKTRGRSFRDLVSKVDPKADAKVLIDDLLRSGVVVPSGDRFFKVLSRTYVMPEGMSPAMFENFGRALTNLANTLEFNMDDSRKGKRLERAVFADNGLTTNQLEEFEKFGRARVQQLISEIDDWLGQHGKESAAEEQRFDTGISIFHYVIEPSAEPSLSSLLDAEQPPSV